MFRIEIDHEEDGRWIAEVPDLPAVLNLPGSRGHQPDSRVGGGNRLRLDRATLRPSRG